MEEYNHARLGSGKITGRTREMLSRRFAQRHSKLYGMEDIYAQSQQWAGFGQAFTTWSRAYWRLIDQETPNDVADKVKEGISMDRIDWSSFGERYPGVTDRPGAVEIIRQQYLEHRAFFFWAMRGIEATESDTYSEAIEHMEAAKRIGDDSFFQALARQKNRKPTKDKGRRRLKYLILLGWVPGCMWAFTTDGIREMIKTRYGQEYDPRTLSGAWHSLRLYRSLKPLWRGLAGTPPKLLPR